MTTISVQVKASSRTHGIEDIGEGRYLMRVRAPAREGKANIEVVDMLAEYFGVAKSLVRIRIGASAKWKIIDIG